MLELDGRSAYKKLALEKLVNGTAVCYWPQIIAPVGPLPPTELVTLFEDLLGALPPKADVGVVPTKCCSDVYGAVPGAPEPLSLRLIEFPAAPEEFAVA